jgi:hypothetical protein
VSARLFRCLACLALTALLAAAARPGFGQQPSPPVVVKIQQEKPQIEEASLPVDMSKGIVANATYFPGMAYGLTIGAERKRLTFSDGSARTTIRFDNQNIFPNAQQKPLPPGPGNRKRYGVISTFRHADIHITQTMEIVPGKPGPKPAPGQKRLMDTLLVRYTVENKGNQARSVGVRIRMDTYCWNTDGPHFAAATRPGRILDGHELKGKDVPDFITILAAPQNNPPWKAYFTTRFGSKYEGPDRVILTSHGAGEDGWNVQVFAGQFDTDAVFYWEPKVIPPGGKRELAFAHGQGIASNPEGRLSRARSSRSRPMWMTRSRASR